jgi:uncharacterized protein (DUF1501 family)
MNEKLFRHPDCPDWTRLGSTPEGAALRVLGDAATADEETRTSAWSRGFNRRRLLAGGMGVGVTGLAHALSTTRVSFAAESDRTLVVIFLRGGMDGLSVMPPADDPDLLKARPGIAVRAASLIPFQRGFGFHPAMEPLRGMISGNKVAAVPAIATPDLSRSHFQAQDCLEQGGAAGSSAQSGWLNRVLEASGPGTTFRGVGASYSMARSLVGTSNPIIVSRLDQFKVWGDDKKQALATKALGALYTGLDHPIAVQTRLALDASTTALTLAKDEKKATDRGFADGQFGEQLATLSTLIRAGVGLRVATMDLGNWDMHTGLGTVDDGDMRNNLGQLASGLATFFAELGPAADKTTVVLMSEFGRRLGQNDNAGVDHGHGGLGIVMGGGVKGGVYGKWDGLAENVLDQGDVPGSNDYRNFLGEVVMGTLGLSAGAMAPVFPKWTIAPYGVMA